MERKRVIESFTERELEILRLIAEGLSDREISQKLYLSINTVKWHNRQIYQKLEVSSRAKAAAAAQELGLLEVEKNPPVRTTSRIPHTLPTPISSFVGREKEIDEIKELLAKNRLVTLIGPGGVGKTRLALETARTFLDEDDYPDGIYFIELAPVLRLERVARAVIEALKLSPPPDESPYDSLTRFLRDRKALLFLDNFEHLLEAATLVSELLSAAPGLQILCTSREALHLTGEQLYPVQPLAIHPSQQLFIERVGEANPAFDPAEDELILISNICARLDHLPLAIELAAARMNLFSLENLLERLEDRFRVLKNTRRDSDERHQTLQDAIDWSYDLLKEDEQILFRRLSVFQGSRSIDAVEEVCCFDLNLNVLDGLSALLAKNLIRKEEGLDGQPRFYLLESMHEYTSSRLSKSGEGEQIQRRHAEFFISVAEKDKDPSLSGMSQIRWLKRLKADHDNLRKVYTWSMDKGEVALGLKLVGYLGYFWMAMGSHDEGEKWVKESLVYVDSVPISIQADLYRVAGTILYICSGNYEKSKKMYHKALTLYTQLEDIREIGWSYVGLLGISKMFPEESAFALEYFNKSLEYLTKVGDQAGLCQAWLNLSLHYEKLGNNTEARRASEESLRIARDSGDFVKSKVNLGNLGDFALEDGDILSARKYFMESIKVGLEIGLDFIFTAPVLISIANTEFELDRPHRAVKLIGASDMFFKLGAHHLQAAHQEDFDEFYQFSRSQLSEEEYDQAWQEGQALTPEEAIAYALDEEDPGL